MLGETTFAADRIDWTLRLWLIFAFFPFNFTGLVWLWKIVLKLWPGFPLIAAKNCITQGWFKVANYTGWKGGSWFIEDYIFMYMYILYILWIENISSISYMVKRCAKKKMDFVVIVGRKKKKNVHNGLRTLQNMSAKMTRCGWQKLKCIDGNIPYRKSIISAFNKLSDHMHWFWNWDYLTGTQYLAMLYRLQVWRTERESEGFEWGIEGMREEVGGRDVLLKKIAFL